jgi:menaquinone-dependent protoporphyrinogen oxidase
MTPILLLFATREGQTRHIAQHLAAAAPARGLSAQVVDAAQLPVGFSLDNYSAAILSASVHCGRHEKEMIDFVKRHKAGLEHLPTVFLSVSLSEVGAEDAAAPPERRGHAAADVQRMIDAFLAETGWHPEKIQAVAGALRYTKYNRLLRFVMKRIAARAGGSTDTSQDHEYTDWAALDRLIDELQEALCVTTAPHLRR